VLLVRKVTRKLFFTKIKIVVDQRTK